LIEDVQGKEEGFTFIELAIAVAMLGVLAMAGRQTA
jgi:prepilin-type N-terminal cleavage/methylation domain-containing protein